MTTPCMLLLVPQEALTMERRAVKLTLNPSQAFFDGTPEEKKADTLVDLLLG